MSTLHGTGEHRIVYKAGAFATGKTVTAYIWNPSLVKSGLQTLTEVSDGLYYLDYTFAATGAYFGIFYENDVAMTPGTFRICSSTVDAAAVADAVWNEAYADHVTPGTYGILLGAAFEEV